MWTSVRRACPPAAQVRTYLGAPLRWMDGSYLGTVCLLDSQPKESVSFKDCEPLMRAADDVMCEFAHHVHFSPSSVTDVAATK